MRIVDLSIPLENDVPADPPFQRVRIDYEAHDTSAPKIASLFPGLKPEDLPDAQGWAVETVQISTHNGTHVDAPWHYHPTMDGGAPAITIDEVPLEWCFQSGVKLDFVICPTAMW
ncbi:kynurenine formamidase [Rhodoligotrophos appendicifer]